MKKEEKTRLTREKIIEAAVAEFGTKGYENANINSISDSGISKGLIYHNFAGKDELYLECLKICFAEITEALACPENISDHSVYFEKRIKLFNEKVQKCEAVPRCSNRGSDNHIGDGHFVQQVPYALSGAKFYAYGNGVFRCLCQYDNGGAA